jgi:hypothetical protein
MLPIRRRRESAQTALVVVCDLTARLTQAITQAHVVSTCVSRTDGCCASRVVGREAAQRHAERAHVDAQPSACARHAACSKCACLRCAHTLFVVFVGVKELEMRVVAHVERRRVVVIARERHCTQLDECTSSIASLCDCSLAVSKHTLHTSTSPDQPTARL